MTSREGYGGMHVDAEVVREFPKEPSGKVRCVTPKVGWMYGK